ncbi:MAG: 30S ribosomal protein S20 [Dehalococcoidia bacterium]|nr:30S ribosomal protein S20 [Dehalococcoidia bacterium]
MAHSKQARKRIRQNERQAAHNRPIRTYTSRRVRDARDAIESGDAGSAEALRVAQSALDRAAKSGVIHPNTAARRKSRLAAALNKAQAAS